jgi:hypothetical protein
VQSFHQGYTLINQYFGGLKGLRTQTPGRRQTTVSAEDLTAFYGELIYGCGCLMGHFLVSLCEYDCGLSTTPKGEYWRIRTSFGGFRGTIWFGHHCNRVALWPLASLDTCSCGYRYLLGLTMPTDHPLRGASKVLPTGFPLVRVLTATTNAHYRPTSLTTAI